MEKNKKRLSLMLGKDDAMLTGDSERGEASSISIAYLSYQGEQSSNWKGSTNVSKRELKPKIVRI